jgi:hypothetical protein
MSEEVKMQKRILMLATSAFILACGGTAATAQQGPMMQQQAQLQQKEERTPQGAKCRAVVLEMTSTMTPTYRAGARA